MNCTEFDTVLNENRTKNLSRDERVELEEHLRSCGRCSAAWFAHEVLAAETAPAAPPELLPRIAASLDRPAVTSPRGSDLGRPIPLGLAAAAGLLALALWLGDFGAPGQEPGSEPQANVAEESPVAPDLPVLAPLPLRFVAGQHYETLPGDPDPVADAGRVQVAEFFMYPCPHCYEFEPGFDAWCELQADNVDIVRVPVLWNALARLHARAYYTAEAMGVLDETHVAFFEAFHVERQALDSEAALRRFFGRFGIDADRFETAFNSVAVQDKLAQAEELNRRYRIQATPSIVVNGRHVTTPTMAGSYSVMLEIVDELIVIELEGYRQNCDVTNCRVRDREGDVPIF